MLSMHMYECMWVLLRMSACIRICVYVREDICKLHVCCTICVQIHISVWDSFGDELPWRPRCRGSRAPAAPAEACTAALGEDTAAGGETSLSSHPSSPAVSPTTTLPHLRSGYLSALWSYCRRKMLGPGFLPLRSTVKGCGRWWTLSGTVSHPPSCWDCCAWLSRRFPREILRRRTQQKCTSTRSRSTPLPQPTEAS